MQKRPCSALHKLQGACRPLHAPVPRPLVTDNLHLIRPLRPLLLRRWAMPCPLSAPQLEGSIKLASRGTHQLHPSCARPSQESVAPPAPTSAPAAEPVPAPAEAATEAEVRRLPSSLRRRMFVRALHHANICLHHRHPRLPLLRQQPPRRPPLRSRLLLPPLLRRLRRLLRPQLPMSLVPLRQQQLQPHLPKMLPKTKKQRPRRLPCWLALAVSTS